MLVSLLAWPFVAFSFIRTLEGAGLISEAYLSGLSPWKQLSFPSSNVKNYNH